MNVFLKAAFLAAASTLAVTAVAPPAVAQSKLGIATANLRGAIANCNAYRTALSQIQVTYKAQIDARDSRQKVLQAELNALAVAYEAEAKKPGANEKTVAPSAKAFQDKQAAAQAEIGKLSQQIELSLAYVEDQISLKIDDAVKGAMETSKVDLLLTPEAVIARAGTTDISRAVIDQLNTLVPSVQIVPPANYQPGQLVNQQQNARAAAAQQTGAAPAAPVTVPGKAAAPGKTPAPKPQPESR
jgi:Skp family chaperone for outer membrane proteins